MNHQPEIAIVEANTLTSLGLKGILEEMIPMATIRTFHQFSELMDDTPDMYAHYFISAQIYVEHNAFFLPRKRKTIVLASDSPQFQLSGVPVLNIHESEEELVKNILKLHQHAHHNGYPVKDMPSMPPAHNGHQNSYRVEPLSRELPFQRNNVFVVTGPQKRNAFFCHSLLSFFTQYQWRRV